MQSTIAPETYAAMNAVRTSGRSASAQPALPALTGLRFLAASWVVLFHTVQWWRPGLIPVLSAPGLAHVLADGALNILMHGNVAVIFFFMLSGFILSYTYIQGRSTLRGGLRRYYIARFARIYPVYVVAFILAAPPYLSWGTDRALHAACTSAPPLAVAATTLMLVQRWLPDWSYCWNSPGWSLSAEAFFYLLFPLAAWCACRLSRRHLRIALGALWLIYLFSVLGHLALLFHPGASVFETPLGTLPPFLMGVVLGRLFVLRPTRRMPIHSNSLALIALALAAAFLASIHIAFLPLYEVAVTPLFALLIYGAAHGQGPVARVCALPVMVALGEASYALYILHWPVWDWLTRLLHEPTAAPVVTVLPALELSAAYGALLITLSLFTLRWVEQPARRAIRHAYAYMER